VFCIEPVGTVTACKTNVIPKIAIISVTTNDSKYSRAVDFGGPSAFLSVGSLISCSFLLIIRLIFTSPVKRIICQFHICFYYAAGCRDVLLFPISFFNFCKARFAAIISAAFIEVPLPRTAPVSQTASTRNCLSCGGPSIFITL